MQHAAAANEVAQISWLRRNDGRMTDMCDYADTTQHHRSVSDGADEWEYVCSSVRDMASFGFLFSRLA
jgi:hypothetical protein